MACLPNPYKPGAHYPERATSLFSCNGALTSGVILRYDFPAKIIVSGYVRIDVWVKTMVARLRCFCYCIMFSSCRFPSFLKLVLPQFHAFYLHFPHVQVKQRHTFECEFFRLNPRFVSFSCAFAMVKDTFKRIQKKWKDLIWRISN